MKLILAPMASLTHAALRMLIHRFRDPDEYFTEMIHAPSLVAGGPFEPWYLRTQPVPEKIVWQLTSHDSEAFVKAVPIVLANGGMGIDLNMGCCAPAIVRSGAGFAWMLKPQPETAAMVQQVKRAIDAYCSFHNRAIPIRLSVKLRLGTTLDYAQLLIFCRMLVAEGVDLITIHPRLQRQSYSRPALHTYTAQLAADLPIPVYGNGDIDSPQKLQRIAALYPCAGWMIGRAVVQKPWLFQQLQQIEGLCTDGHFPCAPSVETKIDMLEIASHFLTLLATEQPEVFHRTRAQRFFQFFCENFSFAHYCKTKILRANTFAEIETILAAYFQEVPQDRFINRSCYDASKTN
ncbi:MAG: tRNA-dihydrouridine synthase family protein [Treponema sp.]